MNHVFLIRRCHDFSHISSYFLSTHSVECGLLWVFWHHCLPWRRISYEASWVWCQTFQAVYPCKDNKILLNMASTFQLCFPSPQASGLWPLCSNALILCARPSWQCGRADVSPEEERFKLAQACPPGLCAGASSSCGVRVHPSGGAHSSGVGEGGGLPVLLWHLLQHWLAFGSRAAAGHESHAPR